MICRFGSWSRELEKKKNDKEEEKRKKGENIERKKMIHYEWGRIEGERGQGNKAGD